MPDPQQQSAPDVVIVDDSGTEHHFPAGFDVRHAIAIVKNHGSSALPTKPVSAEDFTGTNLPLITGTTNAQELRTIGQEIGPENAKRVREMQAYGEDAGLGLGAAALTGGTSALGNAIVKGSITPLAYRAGQALGVPPVVLDTAMAVTGIGAIPSIRRAWQGAPMPETPLPTNQLIEGPPRMFGGGSRLANTNAQLDALSKAPEPPPEPTPTAPIPRLSSITRGNAQWRSLDPAAQTPPPTPTTPPVPQQTSSIRPTPNAFVNVDKGAPLPTDEARTFSTGVTDPGERARMSETHTVLNQEHNAYRGMKNEAGPDAGAILREALLKKSAPTAANLTPTVGPALLQALLDSLKTGGR